MSGEDWATCRALLDERLPSAVAQAVKDADTSLGIELPAPAEWAFGPAQAAAIDRPVLSVLGADPQPLWVEVAEFLRTAVPRVEERAIDGVGHLLHVQRPEPVARAMAEFLGRHPMVRGRGVRSGVGTVAGDLARPADGHDRGACAAGQLSRALQADPSRLEGRPQRVDHVLITQTER